VSWNKIAFMPEPPSGLSGPWDQKVAFDRLGILYVTVMDRQLNSYVYSRSISPSMAVNSSPAYGKDQPQLEIDNNPSSNCLGRVYSPWNDVFNEPHPLSMMSFSTDGGLNMFSRRLGDDNYPNRTTRMTIAPDGKVYVLYKTQEGRVDGRFERALFRILRSDDCGETWITPGGGMGVVHETEIAETWNSDPDCHDDSVVGFGSSAVGKGGHRKFNRSISSDAWIAVGPDGVVYAAYVNRSNSGFSRIYVARSQDQGMTWASHPISDSDHHSAFPEIAVAANGTLGVLYIDVDEADAKNPVFRHHFARSFDNGDTWSDQILQVLDLDSLDIPNYLCGFIWGDYEGLTAQGNVFYGVFTGQSMNRSRKELDPIFFRETAASP
jgi:hypothetical protein